MKYLVVVIAFVTLVLTGCGEPKTAKESKAPP